MRTKISKGLSIVLSLILVCSSLLVSNMPSLAATYGATVTADVSFVHKHEGSNSKKAGCYQGSSYQEKGTSYCTSGITYYPDGNGGGNGTCASGHSRHIAPWPGGSSHSTQCMNPYTSYSTRYNLNCGYSSNEKLGSAHGYIVVDDSTHEYILKVDITDIRNTTSVSWKKGDDILLEEDDVTSSELKIIENGIYVCTLTKEGADSKAITFTINDCPYTVSFDSNKPVNASTNIQNSMADMEWLHYGQTYTLTQNAYKLHGYTFEGWNTEADGSGSSYADEASIFDAGNLTLYAQWQPIPYKQEVYIRYQNADGTFGDYEQSDFTVGGTDYSFGDNVNFDDYVEFHYEDAWFADPNFNYRVDGERTEYVTIYRKQFAIDLIKGPFCDSIEYEVVNGAVASEAFSESSLEPFGANEAFFGNSLESSEASEVFSESSLEPFGADIDNNKFYAGSDIKIKSNYVDGHFENYTGSTTETTKEFIIYDITTDMTYSGNGVEHIARGDDINLLDNDEYIMQINFDDNIQINKIIIDGVEVWRYRCSVCDRTLLPNTILGVRENPGE